MAFMVIGMGRGGSEDNFHLLPLVSTVAGRGGGTGGSWRGPWRRGRVPCGQAQAQACVTEQCSSSQHTRDTYWLTALDLFRGTLDSTLYYKILSILKLHARN